jgi:putative ABC transport system permease protein
MIKDLLKHSIRSFGRQKNYVLINVLGLSIGIACSLLISIYVIYELSYDSFNEKSDRIYRVILDGKIGGQEVQVSSTASPIGPTMLQEFPEVEDYTRLNVWGSTILKVEENNFTEDAFMEVDSSFFRIFTIPLLKGNLRTVLDAPYKLALSESTAKKIFGDTDPMDKTIKVGNDSSLYKVTGIFKDIPGNSHFEANVIGSFLTNRRANDNQWLSNSFNTYVLLKDGTNYKDVDSKTPDMIAKYVGPLIQQYFGITIDDFFSQGNRYRMFLQPLPDIHLQPEIQQDTKPANDPKYLYIFASIALLIIVIAAINFMNLSTAQAAKRAKEVGIKKVSGSTKGMLMRQFLTESLILSFISLIVSIFIIELSLPYFNNLLQVNLELNYLEKWYTIPSLLGITIFVGLLSGVYPAFYLSAFKPVLVLKGNIKDGMKNGKLRSALVILQFSISIILIIGTTIMFRQIHYMQNKNLGFDKEQLLVIQRAGVIGNKIKSFKEELLKINGVLKVSASTALPAHNNNNNGHMVEGRREETLLLETNWVDYDYLETIGLTIAEGRFFDKNFPSDVDACVINQMAIHHFNFSPAIGTRFISDLGNLDSIKYMPVIGVVNDFHFRSLQQEITPYIFIFKNDNINWGFVTVKLSGNSIKNVVNNVENVWKDFSGNEPMQYFFLDESFNSLYKEEARNSKLAIIFAVLAILIAALGLFGLTSFTIEQRTKEIGIRKAMGASVTTIFYLIAKEIIVLISISTLIAWPLIYYVGKNWLQNYHYRINLNIFDFLIGFVIAIIIAVLTISYRTIRSAKANPVDSLRYE